VDTRPVIQQPPTLLEETALKTVLRNHSSLHYN